MYTTLHNVLLIVAFFIVMLSIESGVRLIASIVVISKYSMIPFLSKLDLGLLHLSKKVLKLKMIKSGNMLYHAKYLCILLYKNFANNSQQNGLNSDAQH